MIRLICMEAEAGLHPSIEDQWIEQIQQDLTDSIERGWPEDEEQPHILDDLNRCAACAPSPIINFRETYDDQP